MKRLLAAIAVALFLSSLVGFSANPADMFSQQATIEETVLVDESGVKITAVELAYTDYSAELTLLLENNSDRDLSFRCETMAYAYNSVNGYMIDDGYMNADVAMGKKSFETIDFSANALFVMGMTDIAEIELAFDISDNNYDTYLRTGPRQVKTELADTYDYATDTYQEAMNSSKLADIVGFSLDYFAADTLYEQNGIRLISQTVVTNKDGEQSLFLEMENTSDEPVTAIASKVYLNGLLVYDSNYESETINPGKRAVMDMSLSFLLEDSYRTAYGIESIGDITFSLTLKDMDYNTICDAEEINITFPGAESSFSSDGEELYNEGGLRVVYKDIIPDSSSYNEDLHILLLVENGTDGIVCVDTGWNDTLSINGFMTDYYGDSAEIDAGRSAIFDVQALDDSLEENRIGGIDDILDAEITLSFSTPNGDDIASPVITITRGS